MAKLCNDPIVFLNHNRWYRPCLMYNMTVTTAIGIGASIFTGTSLLPQLIKVFKEKSADGISFWMLFTLLTGLCLWVIYGIKIGDLILVIANGFSAVLNLLLIVAGITYSSRNKPGLIKKKKPE